MAEFSSPADAVSKYHGNGINLYSMPADSSTDMSLQPPGLICNTDLGMTLEAYSSAQSVNVPKTAKSEGSAVGGSAVAFTRMRPNSVSVASSAPSESSVCRLCLLSETEAEEKLIRLRCQCKGSVRFVHKSCAKRWIRVRGDRSECEMCGEPMLAETKLGRCFRTTASRWRNASYKETVVAFSLLAFLFWLFAYCIYLFSKGLSEVLSFNKEARGKTTFESRSRDQGKLDYLELERWGEEWGG